MSAGAWIMVGSTVWEGVQMQLWHMTMLVITLAVAAAAIALVMYLGRAIRGREPVRHRGKDGKRS